MEFVRKAVVVGLTAKSCVKNLAFIFLIKFFQNIFKKFLKTLDDINLFVILYKQKRISTYRNARQGRAKKG